MLVCDFARYHRPASSEASLPADFDCCLAESFFRSYKPASIRPFANDPTQYLFAGLLYEEFGTGVPDAAPRQVLVHLGPSPRLLVLDDSMRDEFNAWAAQQSSTGGIPRRFLPRDDQHALKLYLRLLEMVQSRIGEASSLGSLDIYNEYKQLLSTTSSQLSHQFIDSNFVRLPSSDTHSSTLSFNFRTRDGFENPFSRLIPGAPMCTIGQSSTHRALCRYQLQSSRKVSVETTKRKRGHEDESEACSKAARCGSLNQMRVRAGSWTRA